MKLNNEVGFTYGTKEQLEDLPVENGKFRYTSDEKKLYVDLNDERVDLSGELKGYQVVTSKEKPTSDKIGIWFKIEEEGEST